jgi:hypothetical protein
VANDPCPSRPQDENSGAPFMFDIGCLTEEQRVLWAQHHEHLAQWAAGDVWQVTHMELWSFDQICMMEAGSRPTCPPELLAEIAKLDGMLMEYMRNLATGRKQTRPRRPAMAQSCGPRRSHPPRAT